MAAERETIEVELSPEVAVAMKLIGLEGEKLAQEMRQATAIDLFRRGLLSIGRAAELAGMGLALFMELLVAANVPTVEYGAEDVDKGLRTLGELAL